MPTRLPTPLAALLAISLAWPASAQPPDRIAQIKADHAGVEAAVKRGALKVFRLGFEVTVPAVGPQTRQFKLHVAPDGSLRKLTVAYDVAASAEVVESFWFRGAGELMFHYSKATGPENCAKGQPQVEAITEVRHWLAGPEVLQVKLAMRGGKTTPPECDQWFRGKTRTRPGEASDAKTAQRLVRAAAAYAKAAKHLQGGGDKSGAIALIKAGER